MMRKEHFALEAHPGAATLYVTGAVSVPALLRALRHCEGLPTESLLLRVDLSAAEPLDQGTLRVLWHSLRRWREMRGAVTRVSPPPGTHKFVTEALHAPCRTMTRRAHFARMLTRRR
jgi:ABC-type transporter Mla MlaB component